MRVAVLGGGVFGTATAVTLAQRGHEVVLHEAGAVPRPEASSTDLSKLVRMDYGTDRFYRDLGAEAIVGWERWNDEGPASVAPFRPSTPETARGFGASGPPASAVSAMDAPNRRAPAEGGRIGAEPASEAGPGNGSSPRPLYHPDGILVLASRWEPGGFERDSWDALDEIGLAPPVFDRVPLAAWRWDGPGYLNPRGGWAESGAVVDWLAKVAVAAGAKLVERSRPTPDEVDADRVIVASGVWTPALVPELRPLVEVVGQPILHLRPPDPDRWRPPWFVPFACGIATTGWYGFPANADGIVKIANHGPGVPIDPDAPRPVDPAWDERLRRFLRAHLPDLAEAPIVGRRLCLYSDVFDGDFVIDRVPGQDRVLVATGGSGHAFKFAPVLGALVANRLEDRPDPRLDRFRWRAPGPRRPEQARHDA